MDWLTGWLVGLAFLAAAMRAWMILFVKTDTDEWYHLHLARELRQNRYRLMKKEKRFTVNLDYVYPPLLHVILAPMVDRISVRWIRAFYALMDGVVALFVFAIATMLGAAPHESTIAALLYLVSPINVVEGTFLNARLPGLVAYMLSIWGLLSFLMYKDMMMLAVTIVSFAIMALTHRMALQTALASFFLASTASWAAGQLIQSAWIIALPIVSLVTAQVMTFGAYARVLKEHVALIRAHATEGVQFMNPAKILAYAPIIALGVGAGYFGTYIFDATARMILISFTTGPMLLSIIWPWGDGTRHAYYAVPVIAILLAGVPELFSLEAGGAIATATIATIGVVLTGYFLQAYRAGQITSDLEHIFEFFNRHPGTITCLPTYRCSLLWFTKNPVANASNTADGFLQHKEFLKAKYEPEVLARYVKQHSVRWILMEGYTFSETIKSLGYHKEYQKGSFGVYRVA